MSNSTTILDYIAVNQAQKETSANALFDACSPAMLYGRRASTSGGLVWGYYGGTALLAGVPTQIANGTISLTASATNYLEADSATGAVTKSTSGFTVGRIPLYQIMAGASTVSSYTDMRAGVLSAADPAVAATAAVAAHEAKADPHSQYLTQTEGDARYATLGASAPVSSVNGKTGAVTLNAADVGADAAGAASSAVSAHVAASDPHGQYALESTIGQANGIASLGSDGKVPAAQLPASSSSGTVTSVALTTPGVLFDVAGSPVTGAGTLAMSLKAQVKNTFLAGPASGADAAPTMRALTASDLPAQPFDLTAFYPGVPGVSAIITRVPVARAVTFPASLAGSIGKARVAATAQTDFDVQKNGTSVGTIRFGASATSASFIAASAITLAAGDILSVIGPATPDNTLADIGFVLAGTR